jgi:hypothetical protein
MAYNQSQFSQPMDFYGNPVAPPVRVSGSKGKPRTVAANQFQAGAQVGAAGTRGRGRQASRSATGRPINAGRNPGFGYIWSPTGNVSVPCVAPEELDVRQRVPVGCPTWGGRKTRSHGKYFHPDNHAFTAPRQAALLRANDALGQYNFRTQGGVQRAAGRIRGRQLNNNAMAMQHEYEW